MPCQKCGHVRESVVKSLIFSAQMHYECSGSMEEFDQLDRDLLAIDADLCAEIKKKGTRSPLGKHTLSQLRQMYA